MSQTTPKLDRKKLNVDILNMYADQHAALGESGTNTLLVRGHALSQEFNLADILRGGGVLVFPHACVADCGHQIAACVHACIESGADKVLVVSVLHAFTQDMEDARIRVANGSSTGEGLDQEPLRCIQGPGLDSGDNWKRDHVLISFRHFWDAETKRRGIKGTDKEPQVIERYPYLAGGYPDTLPGIEELMEIVNDKNTVIVSTADPFHHGIGYGDAPENAYEPDEEGFRFARETINEGISLLAEGDYWGYNQHCVRAKSDARDAGQVFRYLRGAMEGRIIDFSYSDSTELYGTPAPTWVAAPLIEWKKV
ncbi:MAG: hypothetical protein F6K56_13475 [Moorea sp. SIO3G5]|nr:hypothetical protein [Moorena sp. SIO3G5]